MRPQYRTDQPGQDRVRPPAPPDSIQGPAGADYVYNDLGAHSVYILDDTETFGVGIGDSSRLSSSSTAALSSSATARPSHDRLHLLFTAGCQPEAGGCLPRGHDPDRHGPRAQAGPHGYRLRDHPVHGSGRRRRPWWPGTTQGSTINIAGEAAANVYGTVAGIHDIPDAANVHGGLQGCSSRTDPGAYSASPMPARR